MSRQEMQLVIDTRGTVCCVYGEMLDVAQLGDVSIRRASAVEPDTKGKWWADLSPVSGPTLGPFAQRSDALIAEAEWLDRHLITAKNPNSKGNQWMPSSGSSSLSCCSSSPAGPTSAAPAEPTPRRSIRRLLVHLVTVVALAMATLCFWMAATQRRTLSSPNAVPTVEQVRQLADLVTAKITFVDVHETTLAGYLGNVKAVLVVRGEVLLGPDLSPARIVTSDDKKRQIVIELPRPRVISHKLDHSGTRLAYLTHDGLWVIMPGDAGRTAVLNRAYAEAEHALAAAARKPELIEQARMQAERVLKTFFVTGGWSVQIRWMDR